MHCSFQLTAPAQNSSLMWSTLYVQTPHYLKVEANSGDADGSQAMTGSGLLVPLSIIVDA